jgi:hypothetical protein
MVMAYEKEFQRMTDGKFVKNMELVYLSRIRLPLGATTDRDIATYF